MDNHKKILFHFKNGNLQSMPMGLETLNVNEYLKVFTYLANFGVLIYSHDLETEAKVVNSLIEIIEKTTAQYHKRRLSKSLT